MQALTFMSEEHIQQPAFSKVDWFTSFFSYTICEGGTGGGGQGFGGHRGFDSINLDREHSSITSSKRWVGGVRKCQFLMIYSTVECRSTKRWVGLKKPKT